MPAMMQLLTWYAWSSKKRLDQISIPSFLITKAQTMPLGRAECSLVLQNI